MFKMSSRSQMKHRAQKNSKKVSTAGEQVNTEQDDVNTPTSNIQISGSLGTPMGENEVVTKKKSN
jgi:hypothetical protein